MLWVGVADKERLANPGCGGLQLDVGEALVHPSSGCEFTVLHEYDRFTWAAWSSAIFAPSPLQDQCGVRRGAAFTDSVGTSDDGCDASAFGARHWAEFGRDVGR